LEFKFNPYKESEHRIITAEFLLYIPPFSQKVMYHINPAFIKSILSSMPKEEFYRHARYIHSQSLSLPDGSNRQVMFFNLWQWCLSIHKKRFS
jgi:hypothetical protein